MSHRVRLFVSDRVRYRMPGGVSNAMQEGDAAGTLRVSVNENDAAYINRPNIDGCKFFVNGEIREWTGAVQIVESPIFLNGTDQKVRIRCRNSDGHFHTLTLCFALYCMSDRL